MDTDLPPFMVSCRWRTTEEPILLQQCAQWLEQLAEERDQSDFNAGASLMLGPILGHELDERIAHLDIQRGEDELRVTLVVQPRPADDPPAEVAELNQVIGGRAGLLKCLQGSIHGALPIADYGIRLAVPHSAYHCTLVPRLVSSREDEVVGDLGHKVSREHIGFRFESGTLGLQELMITYLHESDELLLRVEGRNPLKLGDSRWLPLADDLLAQVFSRVFKAAE